MPSKRTETETPGGSASGWWTARTSGGRSGERLRERSADDNPPSIHHTAVSYGASPGSSRPPFRSTSPSRPHTETRLPVPLLLRVEAPLSRSRWSTDARSPRREIALEAGGGWSSGQEVARQAGQGKRCWRGWCRRDAVYGSSKRIWREYLSRH